MKKIQRYLLLIGIVLFGCSKNNQTQPLSPSQPLNPTLSDVRIGEDQAKQIALNEAGGGKIIEFSYDNNDRIPNYEVTVLNDRVEYEFEISAIDGSILSKDQELMDQTILPQEDENNNMLKIPEDEAKEIALNEVSGGTIGEFRLEYEDGVPIYEIKIYEDTTEYEFKISGVDGSILSKDQSLKQLTNQTSDSQLNVTEEEAKEIAFNQVSSGTIGEFRLDYENGLPVYEVKIYEGTVEYEFEISGIDGKIISQSVNNRLDS